MTIAVPWFGATGQPFSITIDAMLANSSVGRASAYIDTSSLFEVMVMPRIVMPSSGALGADKAVYIFAYGTANSGSYGREVVTATSMNALTGVDQDYAINVNGTNLKMVGAVNIQTINTSTPGVYECPPFVLSLAFGGQLPQHVGVFALNKTDVTLGASGNAIYWQGVAAQG